jgi:hypothetical protein
MLRLPKIDKLPLYKRKLVVSDVIDENDRKTLVKKIESYGGKVHSRLSGTIFAVISTLGMSYIIIHILQTF